MLLLISFSFAAPCDQSVSSQDIAETADLAVKAFNAQDGDTLLKKRDQLIAQLICVEDPLVPSLVGKIHWVQTLSAFVQARPEDLVGAPNDDRTMAALAGLFDAQTAFQLPLELPPEHTLRALTINANDRIEAPAIIRLPSPGEGRLEVNTKPATMIREQVAAVIQQFDKDNNLLSTCYWWPGDSLEACAKEMGQQEPKILPWVVGSASVLALGGGVGIEIFNNTYWKNNFEDCMGKHSIFPKDYTGGVCGFGTEEIATENYQNWKTVWLGGLGLISAGTLGLAGSGVMVLTNGKMVMIQGEF